jgi:tetratricopeptide (TPR) repeat protein
MGLWLSPGEEEPLGARLRSERGTGEDLLKLLEELFEDRNSRPGRIEVFDPELQELLEERLESSGIEVGLCERLKAVDRLLASIASRFGVPDYQGALDVPGVTVESMRRFARAARDLFESAPWRCLSDRDLIEIHGGAPPGFQYAVVLGMGRGVFGLGFFEDRNAFWEVMSGGAREASGQWLFSYETITSLPPGDARLFVDHGLDVACPNAYPLARRFQSQLTVKRPSPRVLDFLSGLLEALASSGPADFDCGRWECTVETSAGPRSYGFALPYLLEPPSREELAHRRILPDRRAFERFQFLLNRRMDELEPGSAEELSAIFAREFQGKSIDEMPYEPKDDRERAQEICFEAFDAWGRRQILLADQALALDPECVDALVLKGERTFDLREALRFFERAVAAGEKALETDGAREGMGELWSYYPTRPYLRALHSLGHALEESEKPEEAAACYKRLLALDRHDHQGVRYCRLSCLLGAGLYQEAQAHVKAHEEDGVSLWSYARALALFGRHGDGKRAREAIGRAIEQNPLAAAFLLDLDVPPRGTTERDEEDAERCAEELTHVWAETRGALRWLSRELVRMGRVSS